MDLRKVFTHYLKQLEIIVSKAPDEVFSLSLSEGALSLERHAKVAANFPLRGLCPLMNVEVPSFFSDKNGKEAVLKQIEETLRYLSSFEEVRELNDHQFLTDKVGFEDVTLCESEYVHLYILPNFLFHISMVYSITKANGVELGKGDFDGFHSYPAGFSFDK